MKNITKNEFCNLFASRTGIDFSDPHLEGEMFFGSCVNLKPRDLLMVCMDLKERYGISFSDTELYEKKLSSFREMWKTINNMACKRPGLNKNTKKRKEE